MNENADKRYIGLTGSIGTGKSTVARLFGELGCTVLDADKISREALNIGTSCYEKTLARFGNAILKEDGSVDRKALAAIVFSDEAARQDLNGIIHPYVRETMLLAANAAPTDALVIFDIPLLFESRMEQVASFNICVISGEERCIQRVMGRDGTVESAVRARIAAQMPQGEKAALSDAVIENNGTLDELRTRVKDLYGQLTERAGLGSVQRI